MGIPSFFRMPQHKQFHYEPIYYDERKERLEERIREIEQEHGIKAGSPSVRSLRKGSFLHHYGGRKTTQRYSNIRLILIIAFLTFISYFLFFA